jgi:hypothetical protein
MPCFLARQVTVIASLTASCMTHLASVQSVTCTCSDTHAAIVAGVAVDGPRPALLLLVQTEPTPCAPVACMTTGLHDHGR